MRRIVKLVMSLGLLVSPLAPAMATDAAEETGPCEACVVALDLALDHARRDGDRARDAWRHPGETLGFFQVRPGQTVVDYMPSSGWYTRILVPYLGTGGRYIGLNPDVTGGSEQIRNYLGNLAASFPAKAAEWTGMPAAAIPAYNSDSLPAALHGTVDRVLVFREMHNLLRMGFLDKELATIHRLLKPDGLLGVVQHRARVDAPAAYLDGNKGYLREADVIAMVEARGFQLVGKSEINANPNDPADHEAGVWALPPNYRLGETDRDRYTAIGESDRMTLLFRKQP
jgi:predicted methyltransferase